MNPKWLIGTKTLAGTESGEIANHQNILDMFKKGELRGKGKGDTGMVASGIFLKICGSRFGGWGRGMLTVQEP
jgi:hypothetical protein